MKKAVLGIAGVILLGSLGSGFWELALQPILIWITEPMLDIATLGLNSLRDDMYAGAAKGSYDRGGLALFSFFISFVLAGTSALLLSLIQLQRRLKDRSEHPPKSRPPGLSWRRWTTPVMMLMIVLVLAFVVESFRIIYEQKAALYAAQLQRIIAPYVSPEERLTFESRFAQVTSRGDYLALVTDMRDIALKNGAKIPDFDVY